MIYFILFITALLHICICLSVPCPSGLVLILVPLTSTLAVRTSHDPTAIPTSQGRPPVTTPPPLDMGVEDTGVGPSRSRRVKRRQFVPWILLLHMRFMMVDAMKWWLMP